MENARQCARAALAKRADDRAGAEGAAVIEERSESRIEGPKERLAGAGRARDFERDPESRTAKWRYASAGRA